MVAKGTKRKVNETEVAVEKCCELAQQIQAAANLPEDVITMLVDVLPYSLGQPKDKRHRFQEQAVLVVDCVMQSIEESLKKNIEEARSKLIEARRQAAPCENTVTEAEAKVHEDTERFNNETKALAKVTLEFRAARNAVEESKKAQETGDQDYVAATKKKNELQAIISDLIEPLKAGIVPEPELERRTKSLTTTLKQLDCDFDEAIMRVLETSLAKQPSARGGFDTMAVDQLDKYMSDRVAPLDEILDAGEEGKQQRASAVKSAQDAAEGALKNQKLRADTFESIWNAKKTAEHNLEASRQALKDLAASTKSADKALYSAEAESEVFADFTRVSFDQLKDRLTPEPMPEATPEPVQAEPVEMEQSPTSDRVLEDAKLDTGVVLPEAITA